MTQHWHLDRVNGLKDTCWTETVNVNFIEGELFLHQVLWKLSVYSQFKHQTDNVRLRSISIL